MVTLSQALAGLSRVLLGTMRVVQGAGKVTVQPSLLQRMRAFDLHPSKAVHADALEAAAGPEGISLMAVMVCRQASGPGAVAARHAPQCIGMLRAALRLMQLTSQPTAWHLLQVRAR